MLSQAFGAFAAAMVSFRKVAFLSTAAFELAALTVFRE